MSTAVKELMSTLRSFFIILITTIIGSSISGTIRLEWSLGQPLPVSKMLNSGTEQDLFCSIEDRAQTIPVFLQCPMSRGICMDNCNSNAENKHIKCTNLTQNNITIYRYRITVSKSYEGFWNCQHGPAISRNVELTVTNKPYISSFTAVPNPVWRGSSVNLTCEVMPVPGISDIQFTRLFNDNTKMIIPAQISQGLIKYSNSAIVSSITVNRDERFQCIVYTAMGDHATKILNVDILYFPSSLQLISSVTDDNLPVGSVIMFQCLAEGGNPKPVLVLYRQRLREEPEKLIDTSVALSKLDNKATFFCEMEKTAGVKSRMKSKETRITVRYPPDSIELSEESKGPMRESQIQTFVCLSKGGSEPPSEILWSMTDPLGKKVRNIDLEKLIDKDSHNNTNAVANSIRVTILRTLNTYTIVCSIVYENKVAFTQKRIIKVEFGPNSIALNSNPLGAILKGTSVVLTCSTGAANPPPKIQWHKTKPGQKSEDVTLHSNTDLMPANYSGVAVSSSISVYDVAKSDHGTTYKCIVSHAYISTEIIKEYVLNVLFPPIVQVHPNQYPIEEGDNVSLQCLTSGGNPNSASQYRYQWRFCSVNTTYLAPANSDLSNKPTAEFRKHCSTTFHSTTLRQSQTLNISSVTSKHRGWYLCLVYSLGGSAVGYSFLNVLFQPIMINDTPDRVYAKTAEDVIFKFEVQSNPLDIEIRWFFRTQQKSHSRSSNVQLYDSKISPNTAMKKQITMKPFGRFESILFDNYTVCLVIRSILYSDYGDYHCEVSNRLGKALIEYHLFSANDITIPETSISMQFSGRKVVVLFDPPSMGHFSHLVLRICSLDGSATCKDMQISSPLSGKASTILHRSPDTFNYRILVYNGSSLLQITSPIQKTIALQAGSWLEMSFEMLVAIIIGVVGIFLLLFVALVTLILLKCKKNKSKEELFVENNSILTANSRQRQDYFMLNSSANTSLLKNGCHCFPNYPLELRSDNGSDHSVPSQGVYHPMMMRRKTRDNGEINSIHSGSSCRNPDVVLTEKTSTGSEIRQNFSNLSQFNSIGSSNNPTKVTFLNGRLHPFDGQRPDMSFPEDFTIPANMVFAAVDDGTNQTRLIPIATKNLHSEYPLYYQMNNQISSPSYDCSPSPLYSTSVPHCIKPSVADNYRENSSSTNTDSNPYSGTQEPCAVDITNSTNDIRNSDNQ